jgi:Fe-S-cluster containining protein
MPDEVETTARFLDLPENEFIKKYCTEHIEDDVYAISPAQKPGTTECIFLNKKKECDIHEVKPYECRKVFGCEGPARHRRMREIIKKRWRK